jgi:hypothetical protein
LNCLTEHEKKKFVIVFSAFCDKKVMEYQARGRLVGKVRRIRGLSDPVGF